MSEAYLGQIEAYGFDWAPRGWARCDGQLLPINQYQALYSLLGTMYGGDGRTTFALPDLRGRTSLSFGDGNGLTPRTVGQKSGAETVTLNTNEIPAHRHSVSASAQEADAGDPSGRVMATVGTSIYKTAPNAAMNAGMIGLTGNSQGHENMEPYLVINFCIAIQGLFPPRN